MGNEWGQGRRIPAVLCALVATAALAMTGAGCGDDDEPAATTADDISTVTAADDPSTVSAADDEPTPAQTIKCKQGKPSKSKPAAYGTPPQTVKKKEKLTAVVETSCGSFEIELDTQRSPVTVNSFVFLAEKGFYDGLTFDEAAEGTYVHGGDPPGKAGGPGYAVEGEIYEGLIYRRGVVAMADSGEARPPRVGSQFFVAIADPWIDMSRIYPPFGKVKKGLTVLERISEFGPQAPSGPSNTGVIGYIGKLDRTVTIDGITIKKG